MALGAGIGCFLFLGVGTGLSFNSVGGAIILFLYYFTIYLTFLVGDGLRCWINFLFISINRLFVFINCLFVSINSGSTAHFILLDLMDCDLDLEVPREFLVDQRVVYKALRQIKPNKSSGPIPIPNKILKEFAASCFVSCAYRHL